MSAPSTKLSRASRWAVPLSAAVLLTGGIGLAGAANGPSATTSSTAAARGDGTGMNGFGKTAGSYEGKNSQFVYSRGYFCDTSVKAVSRTGCEVGAKWKKAPSQQRDPLFITVPLGFTPKMRTDCPSKLVCIDHPPALDLTRLTKTLAPIFNTTPRKLRPALRNFRTPGHDHFITDKNKGKSEWWDVRVVGVTSPAVYAKIQDRQSAQYIRRLQKNGNKNVTATIPTNLFLFFAAR